MTQLEELANAVQAARATKARLEGELKLANHQLEIVENELVSEMANHGLSSFKDADGVSFTSSTRLFATITDPETALPWLRTHGLANAIRETVHGGTLSAALRELREAGLEIPADCFRLYDKPTLSIRRAR